MTAGPRTLFGKVATLSGAGEREQTVFTPPEILAVPRALWGGRIAYDPCHGHPGFVLTKKGRHATKADQIIREAPRRVPTDLREQIAQGFAVYVESQVNAERRTDYQGLTAPWIDKTFCNPPYKTLEEWLEMSLKQTTDHVILVPVRPHRVWWRAWAREMEIVYLNPVKFMGHDQCFPAPLCLARPGPSVAMTLVCEMMGLGEAI